jgi:hypothetical protein
MGWANMLGDVAMKNKFWVYNLKGKIKVLHLYEKANCTTTSKGKRKVFVFLRSCFLLLLKNALPPAFISTTTARAKRKNKGFNQVLLFTKCIYGSNVGTAGV